MDRLTDVRGIASHLHGKAHFADQFTRLGANNAAAENPMVRFVEQKLGEPLITSIGDGPAGSSPRKHGFAIFEALRPALFFGQASPSNLWVRIGHGRNLPRDEYAVLTGCGFSCNVRLVHRFVRQHRLADDVADREDMRHVGAHLLINGDEAAVAYDNASPLGFDCPPVGGAANCHQHHLVDLGLCWGIFTFETDPDARRCSLCRNRLGLQHDLVEPAGVFLLPHFDKIAIGAGHEAIEHLDHVDA